MTTTYNNKARSFLERIKEWLMSNTCIFWGPNGVLHIYTLSPCTTELKTQFHPSAGPSSQVTVVPPLKRQRLGNDHLSMLLKFFNLPMKDSLADGHHFKKPSQHYISPCTLDQTHILGVYSRGCHPLHICQLWRFPLPR